MKKYSFLFLVIALIVLVLTQQKVIMPFVMDVVKSDTFLIQSKDNASQFSISTSLTNIAFKNCNNLIQKELGADTIIHFPQTPINAWSLGNYQYIVNAEISVSHDKSPAEIKKYACRITYKNGDNLQGIDDINNWSIDGISGIK